jgi:hypothetical protein
MEKEIYTFTRKNKQIQKHSLQIQKYVACMREENTLRDDRRALLE